MHKLFDLIVEDETLYGAALETLVAIGITPGLRLNAERCGVPIIQQLCAEALQQLGEQTPAPLVQMSLF